MAKVSLRNYNREIETMIDRGQLEEAVAHCQHILKTFPKHLETYRLLGKAYLESKRYKDAVDIFSRVLASEPNDFVSNVGMSIIRDEDDKLDDAIWHMERAFETQPSNPAIQGELQRLYGRRDGVQPPRIRMTRGALAHMYLQGELYPQAISEIKSVLKEDLGRSDMSVLLARAYFKSGQKNDAADAANSVLRRYPYCLDANRVLVEILGVDRPESAQQYRQRVYELDPYASQVSGSIFQSNEVGDNAIILDHLEWQDRPAGVQSDFGAARAGSESGRGAQEPDWLKLGVTDSSTPQSSVPSTVPPLPAPTSAENIPDFLRVAGWGESTGAFDESKTSVSVSEESASIPSSTPIEQGDLPDWVKAMMPAQEQPAQPTQEEELPDWIANLGPGALAPSALSSEAEQPDWLKTEEFSQPSQPAAMASSQQPDWLTDFQQSEPSQSSDDTLNWLKGLDQPPVTESVPQPVSDSEPDWLEGFDKPTEQEPASVEQPDWMTQFGNPPTESPAPALSGNDFAFLDELTQPAIQTPVENNFEPPVESAPLMADPAQPSVPASGVDNLGTSQQEIDDSLAWLESLAAKQGATEGLLVKPEDRLEKEPDWVQQVKSSVQEPLSPASPPASSVKVDDLGKSQQEIDDSLAWLENLAAKQGATEGLLVKPEDRKDQEPDWVTQAKTAQPEPSQQKPESIDQPMGKSEQEIDDSLAWLENLAAKQGATEGLLVKPEDRLDKEPDWVTQTKSLIDEPIEPELVMDDQEPSVPSDDMPTWLRGLDKTTTGLPEEEAAPAHDMTGMWFKKLDEPEPAPPVSSEPVDDLPAWLHDEPTVEEKFPLGESETPEKISDSMFSWLDDPKEKPAIPPVQSESFAEDGAPEWLKDFEEEAKPSQIATSDELPAWLRDETGEVLAEPVKIEPTRAADWKPTDKQPEEQLPKPEVKIESPASMPGREKPAPVKRSTSKPVEAKTATPVEPYNEPVAPRSGTPSMPVDPILDSARAELSRSNLPAALDIYGKLIKKGRFLDEVVYDLREALYRFPVEVSIWQSLGDAYMRANRLQDALDAYTKAEELLR